MAAAAQVGHIGELGFVGGRIVGVDGQRSVAGFAGNVGMLTGGPGGGLLVVAHDAGILPSEGDGVLADQFKRARPVVAILPEGLWDNRAANY